MTVVPPQPTLQRHGDAVRIKETSRLTLVVPALVTVYPESSSVFSFQLNAGEGCKEGEGKGTPSSF